MIDRDKVIKGLEGIYRCISPINHSCGYCPYQDNHVECMRRVLSDAITLLKQQKPRVMTLDELTEIYVEFKGDACPIRLSNFDLQKIIMYVDDGKCRLWTGEPTHEQMETVKWE